MNYLGLTNSFLYETGVSDPVLSLVDVNDDIQQAAYWINTSWGSFQRESLWPFRKAEVSFTVNAPVSYTAAARTRAEGDAIVPNSFYSPVGGITQVTYNELRDMRRAGNAYDPWRVTHVADNNGTVETYPPIAGPQVLSYDCWTGLQQLALNDDVPYGLPSDFHQLIVHLAVARHGLVSGGQEGINLYQHHSREFVKVVDDYRRFAGITNGQRPTVNSISL